MVRVRIKCPVCGVILEAEDNPTNYGKYVTCPNCKTRNKFSAFKSVLPVSSQPCVDSETEIRAITDDTVGVLQDPETGRRYLLKEGRNLIGRMTHNAPSQANVPISTDNRHMSRSHLFIDVINGADGRYHAYASNASNRNETRINGILLEKDDKLSLKHQDRLSLAGTELVFLGSRVNDETVIHLP